MKSFRLRRLTPAELALAAEVFGEDLDAVRVRIFAVPVWPRAFVAGPSLIVWPAREVPADFGDAPLHLQATFVHELTHVWQAQNGVNLLLSKIKAGDNAAAYAYELTAGTDFTRLNIEQQARVVEHAFLAARGAQTPFAAELYANMAKFWGKA
jgi:hypothetical protein